MTRIMIIGQPGSGKSTLARRLGDLTGLPVVHIDRIHWMPGWQERARDDKIALVTAAELRATWIIEGGLSATWEHRLSRADRLIVLDIPLPRRAWRVLRRTIWGYGRSRPDLPENCPERFNAEFWRWIWDTRHTARTRMLALMAGAGGKPVHHIQNARDLGAVIAQIAGEGGRHDGS